MDEIISEEVDKNYGLKSFQPGMRGAVGLDEAVIVKLEHRAVENESQGGDELCPHAGQQNGGNDDHQTVEYDEHGAIP